MDDSMTHGITVSHHQCVINNCAYRKERGKESKKTIEARWRKQIRRWDVGPLETIDVLVFSIRCVLSMHSQSLKLFRHTPSNVNHQFVFQIWLESIFACGIWIEIGAWCQFEERLWSLHMISSEYAWAKPQLTCVTPARLKVKLAGKICILRWR